MRTRRLAWALIVYGVAGSILMIVVAAIGLDAAGRAERLAGTANAALVSAAATADAAADAMTGANESLDRGAASASDAASLSRDSSVSLESLAAAMELSIFGAQPLVSLADDFTTAADQAASLADELDGVGDALTGTQADIALVGDRLRDLADDLDALTGSADTSGGLPQLRLIVGLLAIWLAMPAVAALVGGIWLLRSRQPAPISP